MIIPEIPQGVVTIAAAMLAAVVVVVLTLARLGFRLLFAIQARLAALESQVELIWDSCRRGKFQVSQGCLPRGIP